MALYGDSNINPYLLFKNMVDVRKENHNPIGHWIGPYISIDGSETDDGTGVDLFISGRQCSHFYRKENHEPGLQNGLPKPSVLVLPKAISFRSPVLTVVFSFKFILPTVSNPGVLVVTFDQMLSSKQFFVQ